MNLPDSIDLAALMEPVARDLLGEPNPHQSKPPHELRFGTNGSLSVDLVKGVFFDHEAKEGGGVIDLLKRERGYDHQSAMAYIRSLGLLNGSALRPAPARPSSPLTGVTPPLKIVAEYDYADENGGMLFQVVRYEPKTFRQRRPWNDGGWVWGITPGEYMRIAPGGDWRKFQDKKFVTWPDGKERIQLEAARLVLYRLPQLIEAIKGGRRIFFVEGEKDADNLRALGFVATTNPMGANKWEPEYTELLRDAAEVVVIGDNDEGGRKHVELVAGALHGIVKHLRVLDLVAVWPECQEKGDITKWLEAGGTSDKLKEFINARPEWQPPKEKSKPSWRDNIYTAEALRSMAFPEVTFCVPDLIPEGLTLLAGKPKIGKSWFALDVCIAVAAGRYCLGERKPAQGDVLYAAMEDNPRRIRGRMDKVLSPISEAWPAPLKFVHSWRRLDKGGVDDVAAWIKETPNARLVVLDTLAGVKPIRTQQGYIEDYESLNTLQRLANETGVSIIVLHHTRKMEADDPVDTISGTLGLAGSADTLLILNRSSQGTTLYVRGRDVEEAEHAVSFDKQKFRWTILGTAAEVHRSNERGRILAVLDDAKEPMGPSDIATTANMSVNNAKQLLHKMAADGEVEKEGRGQYVHLRHVKKPPVSDPPITSITR